MEQTNTTATVIVTSDKKAAPGANLKRLLAMAGNNPFRYARAIEGAFEEHARDMNGYQRITTFANDFALADLFGTKAIVQTYVTAVKSYMNNYKYFTELILVLNYLCWFWYYNGEETLSKQYAALYHDCAARFDDHYAPADGDTEDVRKMKAEARAWNFDWTD